MRLFLIKNVSRDPQYANRRRANPLYVTKTPTINGKRLFPRTSLQVSEQELPQSEIESLENLIKAGVVTVSVLGGELHIQKLSIDTVDISEEIKEVSEPIPSIEFTEPEAEEISEELEEPQEEEEDVSIPEESSSVEIAEIVEEDEEDSSNYTESDLVKMKNSELRELLSIIDPDFSSAGVKKSILVERILEKQ